MQAEYTMKQGSAANDMLHSFLCKKTPASSGGSGKLIAMSPFVQPCAILEEVCQPHPEQEEERTNGQKQFITYGVELHVSCSVCTEA